MPPNHPSAVGRLCIVMTALAVSTLFLAACGAETAGTAAVIGVSQKNGVERGRQVQEQVQQQLQTSTEQAQQRADPLANGY